MDGLGFWFLVFSVVFFRMLYGVSVFGAFFLISFFFFFDTTIFFSFVFFYGKLCTDGWLGVAWDGWRLGLHKPYLFS